jgi:hypothetical protein
MTKHKYMSPKSLFIYALFNKTVSNLNYVWCQTIKYHKLIWGHGHTATSILKHGTRWRLRVSFMLHRMTAQQFGWAPKPVQTFWSTQKPLIMLAINHDTFSFFVQPIAKVTIPAMVCQILVFAYKNCKCLHTSLMCTHPIFDKRKHFMQTVIT